MPGRSESAVIQRYRRLRLGPQRWSEAEVETLRERWGEVPLSELCSILGRTKNAVKLKARSVGLPTNGKRCPYFTTGELAEVIGVDRGSVFEWVKKGELPAKKLYFGDRAMWYIHPDDAEKWLKEHPNRWVVALHGEEFSRALRDKRFWQQAVKWGADRSFTHRRQRRVPDHLRGEFARFVIEVAERAANRIRKAGRPPRWLREMIAAGRAQRAWERWTPEEDERLRRLLCSTEATYAEIARMLQRTPASVKKRVGNGLLRESA